MRNFCSERGNSQFEKSHFGHVTSYELTHFKKMVRVWKTKSLLFCLRYDPLIVFWRQNHITFIFIKMMSHDLLVQMAYLQSFTFSLSARGSEKRSATQSRSNLALLEKKRKTKYRTGLSYEHRKLVEPKHNCTYSLRSCPLPIIPLRLSRPKKQRSQKKNAWSQVTAHMTRIIVVTQAC